MSLAAKGSRPITVDGLACRWAVSPDSGYNVIVVQAADGNGAKLRVYATNAPSRYASANDNGQPAVTPALIASIIRQGHALGWPPDESGNDIVCDLQPDGSIVPRTAL